MELAFKKNKLEYDSGNEKMEVDGIDRVKLDDGNLIWENKKLNNNFGQCPYCPRYGFKNVQIHIGHMHKCKACKNLKFNCICC